ncbi:glutaredoxin family protein [Arthrobacter castelli]|uniref:glutaredoxin family protein n=1 Tax=Arthrobacter castelli TaxID=271431 RepID=UPI00040AF847|nr:glutaredoxin family protein [Arthrobacter castelli]
MTTPEITVYTQPGCGPCIGIKRRLDQSGVRYRTVDITASSEAKKPLVELGYQSTPVTVWIDRTGEQHAWHGLLPELLDQAVADMRGRH